MAFFHILILGVLHATVVSTMAEEELPLLCNNDAFVPLENIERYDNGSIYDHDSGAIYPKGKYWNDEEEGILYGCACDLELPCLWKCCPGGQAIQSTSNNCISDTSETTPFEPVVKSEDGKWNRSLIEDQPFVYYGHCEKGMSMIVDEENIVLGADGSIVFHIGEVPFRMKPDTFCVDLAVDLDKYVAYNCSNEKGELKGRKKSTCRTIMDMLSPIGVCISIIFLIITFYVYASIPELRNLHGKCLLCHIASLLTVYIIAVLVDTTRSSAFSDYALAAGFVIYFAFLSTFLWLNIICIDISIAFSGLRPVNGTGQDRDGRKFLLYMLYAWGLPLLPLGISLYLEFGDVPNHLIKPNLRMMGWFPTWKSRLIYFNGPVAAIISVNVALFIFTAVKIFKQKEQTKMLMKGDSRRHSKNDENRQRFNLYLKLFIVMGISWIFIQVQRIIGPHISIPDCVLLPTHLFVMLQGLFIFLIFVWKVKIGRKLIKSLIPRFASRMKKQDKPGSSSSDGRSISTVSSTVADGNIKLSSSVVNFSNNSKVHSLETGELSIPSISFGVCEQQDI